MKIAICISGFLRTWDINRVIFEKYVLGESNEHEFDIFIHTYKQNYYEYSSKKDDVIYTEDEIINKFAGLPVKKIVIEDREIVDPQNIENSKRFIEGKYQYDTPIPESSDTNSKTTKLGLRLYDQLRKVNLCNELRKDYEKENSIQYDCVMRTRFDVLYYHLIDWNRCIDGKVHIDIGSTGGQPPDMVHIGTPYVVDICAGRFKYLDKFLLPTESDLKESVSVYIPSCQCHQTIPLCVLHSHNSLGHVIPHFGLEYSEYKIFCRVTRNERYVWIPYQGHVLIENDPQATDLIKTHFSQYKHLTYIM